MVQPRWRRKGKDLVCATCGQACIYAWQTKELTSSEPAARADACAIGQPSASVATHATTEAGLRLPLASAPEDTHPPPVDGDTTHRQSMGQREDTVGVEGAAKDALEMLASAAICEGSTAAARTTAADRLQMLNSLGQHGPCEGPPLDNLHHLNALEGNADAAQTEDTGAAQTKKAYVSAQAASAQALRHAAAVFSVQQKAPGISSSQTRADPKQRDVLLVESCPLSTGMSSAVSGKAADTHAAATPPAAMPAAIEVVAKQAATNATQVAGRAGSAEAGVASSIAGVGTGSDPVTSAVEPQPLLSNAVQPQSLIGNGVLTHPPFITWLQTQLSQTAHHGATTGLQQTDIAQAALLDPAARLNLEHNLATFLLATAKASKATVKAPALTVSHPDNLKLQPASMLGGTAPQVQHMNLAEQHMLAPNGLPMGLPGLTAETAASSMLTNQSKTVSAVHPLRQRLVHVPGRRKQRMQRSESRGETPS